MRAYSNPDDRIRAVTIYEHRQGLLVDLSTSQVCLLPRRFLERPT